MHTHGRTTEWLRWLIACEGKEIGTTSNICNNITATELSRSTRLKVEYDKIYRQAASFRHRRAQKSKIRSNFKIFHTPWNSWAGYNHCAGCSTMEGGPATTGGGRSTTKFLPRCLDVWTFSVGLNETTTKNVINIGGGEKSAPSEKKVHAPRKSLLRVWEKGHRPALVIWLMRHCHANWRRVVEVRAS